MLVYFENSCQDSDLSFTPNLPGFITVLGLDVLFVLDLSINLRLAFPVIYKHE